MHHACSPSQYISRSFADALAPAVLHAVRPGIASCWSHALQANPLLLASVPYNDTQLEHGFNALALLLHDPNPNPPGADLAIAQLLLSHAPSAGSAAAAATSRKSKSSSSNGAGAAGVYGSLVTARTGVLRRTALHLAVGSGLSTERDAQRAPVLELLLDHPDADVNAVDALGVPFQCIRACLRHGCPSHSSAQMA